MFLFVVYVRRHDTFHLHCVNFNAGNSILNLVPGLVLVEESDKEHLDLFAARMQLEYGIFVPLGAPLLCRQIYFNPQHHGAQQLQYSTNWWLGVGNSDGKFVGEGATSKPSRSALRRATSKRKRHRSPGRARYSGD